MIDALMAGSAPQHDLPADLSGPVCSLPLSCCPIAVAFSASTDTRTASEPPVASWSAVAIDPPPPGAQRGRLRGRYRQRFRYRFAESRTRFASKFSSQKPLFSREGLGGSAQRNRHRRKNDVGKHRAVCKTAPAHGCAAATSTQVLVAKKVAQLCRARLLACSRFESGGRMPGFAN